MKNHKVFFFIGVCFFTLFLSVTEGNTQIPYASFLTNPVSGTLSAPAGVQFTDTSSENPTWWLWEFGDGKFSLAQHPLYTYELPGIYSVTLSVANASGVDSVTEDYTVQVCGDPFPVLLEGEGSCGCITEACDNAVTLGWDNIPIQLKAVTIEEDLYFDADASVELKGGYDCSFQNDNLETVIVGTLTISAGTLKPSNIRITSSPAVIIELCDGIDNDGDSQIDEDLNLLPCFRQEGVCTGSVQVCQGASGWSGPDSPECYGASYEVAETICDGLDNDCDGKIDEGMSFDVDGDGATSIGSCAGSSDDCDDNDSNNFPGNPEVCDGFDNNCDDLIDDLTFDVDGDGYTSTGSCTGSADDCNDNNINVNPGVTEIVGDGLDQDCDGLDILSYDNSCLACHNVVFVNQFRHNKVSAPDGTCADCHASKVAHYMPGHYGQTVITVGNNMTSGAIIGCKSCHDWHNEEESGLQWGANIVWPKVLAVFPNVTCDSCHENRAAGHATDNAHNNRIIDSACSQCHTSDTSVRGLPGTGTLVSDRDVDTLHRSDCTLCHSYAGTKLDVAAVEQAIQDGLYGAQITCTTCHVTHPSIDHSGIVITTGTQCGNCHTSSTLVDPADPKVHNACTSCHDANWNRISLAAGKSAPGNCTTCHGDHFPNHSHHDGVYNEVSYDEADDTSQAWQQGCAGCHYDYDIENGTSLGLITWNTIIVEHDLDGIKDGSPNTCDNCHNYNGSKTAPLAAVQNAITSGIPATCATCHTDKVPNVGHGIPTNGKHTEHLAMTDVSCTTCHEAGNYPNFASGTDSDQSGTYNLTETDVCNTCHSPDGTYDGVNNIDYGAKANWYLEIYNPDSSLIAGKEKWCAGCHDEVPSQVRGVLAPNVIGDEDGDYIYGTGWGYYKTGHGLTANENYPSKGEVETLSGRPIECHTCHDHSTTHIDGLPRTFDCSDGCDSDEYSSSYRLKQVGGANPMEVPWNGILGESTDDKFRICVQPGCHDSGPFTDAANPDTNLKTWALVEVEPGVYEDQWTNRHEYHLALGNQNRYPADYFFDGLWDSRINCVTCHNVHGSTRLAMVRDGKLINREPGLLVYYRNDLTDYPTGPPTADPPVPADLPLAASDGTVWRGGSSSNLCSHCHANGNLVEVLRDPYQSVEKAPTLDWTGETDYVSDGVNPDSSSGGSSFYFRVKYTDTNNDAPVSVEVWIDLNDDGDYLDTGEKLVMAEAHTFDNNYMDGKLYYRTEALGKAGDNVLNYRFYASDGTDASGPPTGDSSVEILNSIPTLSWTGETYFVNDGVNPDSGGNGASFEFKVSYTDTENEAPTSIQVWIDEDDSGTYESGEMYTMTAVDGDSDYTDGKLYVFSTILSNAGDDQLNYHFYAIDGFDDATGPPTSDSSVTVMASTNNPTYLEWTTADCLTDGVRPGTGAGGTEFEFLIVYTDPDNECPPTVSDIQVWIDDDDNSSYEEVEKFDLVENDAGDLDCSDGKFYSTSRSLALAGDNILNYRFFAYDGADGATGDPVTGSTVTVMDGVAVRPSGTSLSYNYTSIISAANAVSGNILVYPEDDFTSATYSENFTLYDKDNRTIISTCGADLTIISSPAAGSATITAQDSANLVVDGFSITGATSSDGVYINRVDNTTNTIRNSKIYGNSYGIYINDSDDVPVDINTVEIYNNSTTGIFMLNSDDDANITNSVIHSHTTSGNGAAIRMNNNSTVTITDSAIRDNTTSAQGGAIYINSGSLTITNSLITGNQASSGGAIGTNSGPTVQIINSTVADNQATNGGGMYICTPGSTTISNSIFWKNTATSGNGANIYKACGSGNIGTISYSDMTTSSPSIYNASFTDGGGNISPAQDPLFVGGGDYHIQSGSPCEDAIIPANYIGPIDDIDGDSRPQNTNYDIGADENIAP